MKRGSKPRPTAAKRLDGNPGKRPLPVDEPAPPVPDARFDTPPPELADLTVGAAEWRRLAPLLREARQITEADTQALLALCIEWDRYIEARALAFPRIQTSRTGWGQPNPWLAIQTRALAGCLRLWAELGLTPSSRTRVRTAPGGPDDGFAEFDEPTVHGAAH